MKLVTDVVEFGNYRCGEGRGIDAGCATRRSPGCHKGLSPKGRYSAGVVRVQWANACACLRIQVSGDRVDHQFFRAIIVAQFDLHCSVFSDPIGRSDRRSIASVQLISGWFSLDQFARGSVQNEIAIGRLAHRLYSIESHPNETWLRLGSDDKVVLQLLASAVVNNIYTGPNIVIPHFGEDRDAGDGSLAGEVRVDGFHLVHELAMAGSVCAKQIQRKRLRSAAWCPVKIDLSVGWGQPDGIT